MTKRNKNKNKASQITDKKPQPNQQSNSKSSRRNVQPQEAPVPQNNQQFNNVPNFPQVPAPFTVHNGMAVQYIPVFCPIDANGYPVLPPNFNPHNFGYPPPPYNFNQNQQNPQTLQNSTQVQQASTVPQIEVQNPPEPEIPTILETPKNQLLFERKNSSETTNSDLKLPSSPTKSRGKSPLLPLGRHMEPEKHMHSSSRSKSPKVKTPKPQVKPKKSSVKAAVSKVSASKVSVPKVSITKVPVPKVSVSKVSAQKVSVPKTTVEPISYMVTESYLEKTTRSEKSRSKSPKKSSKKQRRLEMELQRENRMKAYEKKKNGVLKTESVISVDVIEPVVPLKLLLKEKLVEPTKLTESSTPIETDDKNRNFVKSKFEKVTVEAAEKSEVIKKYAQTNVFKLDTPVFVPHNQFHQKSRENSVHAYSTITPVTRRDIYPNGQFRPSGVHSRFSYPIAAMGTSLSTNQATHTHSPLYNHPLATHPRVDPPRANNYETEYGPRLGQTFDNPKTGFTKIDRNAPEFIPKNKPSKIDRKAPEFIPQNKSFKDAPFTYNVPNHTELTDARAEASIARRMLDIEKVQQTIQIAQHDSQNSRIKSKVGSGQPLLDLFPANSLPFLGNFQQIAPVQNMPVQNLPIQNLPIQNVPAQNVPVQNLPIQNAPTVQNGLTALITPAAPISTCLQNANLRQYSPFEPQNLSSCSSPLKISPPPGFLHESQAFINQMEQNLALQNIIQQNNIKHTQQNINDTLSLINSIDLISQASSIASSVKNFDALCEPNDEAISTLGFNLIDTRMDADSIDLMDSLAKGMALEYRALNKMLNSIFKIFW